MGAMFPGQGAASRAGDTAHTLPSAGAERPDPTLLGAQDSASMGSTRFPRLPGLLVYLVTQPTWCPSGSGWASLFHKLPTGCLPAAGPWPFLAKLVPCLEVERPRKHVIAQKEPGFDHT